MTKKIPPTKFLQSLSNFPEGDDNTYSWSTRIPKGAYQFLSDLQADWNLPNKSATLREVVRIIYNYIDKLEDIDIGTNVEDTLYYLRAKKEKEERDKMRSDIYKMLVSAEAEEHPPLKARLKFAAKKMAERYHLPWPLPEIPLIQHDVKAHYLLDRAMAIMQENGTNETTLRELVRRSTFDADSAREVLERLEEASYLTTHTESRSGPPTLVINIPTLEKAFAYSE